MALEFFKNSAALCFSGQIPLVCYKTYSTNPDRILIFKECRPEKLDGFGILQNSAALWFSDQITLTNMKERAICDLNLILLHVIFDIFQLFWSEFC
jgi:hypothetical protein